MFEIPQSFSKKTVLAAAFSGVILHITLEAFHHPTMHPFYPLMEKPLYDLMSTLEVRILALVCFGLSIPTYIYKAWKNHSTSLK
ncbi:MAG: hypothetical protein H8Z69_05545 [Nanohaloarchaea archaeon]|nr:hypothetical protein [Candidatus Nanohaloarchaea archaeon]